MKDSFQSQCCPSRGDSNILAYLKATCPATKPKCRSSRTLRHGQTPTIATNRQGGQILKAISAGGQRFPCRVKPVKGSFFGQTDSCPKSRSHSALHRKPPFESG